MSRGYCGPFDLASDQRNGFANALSHCSEQDNFKSHGTDDVDGFGDDYITTARNFLSTWVNNPDDLEDGASNPYQNAENIAAAATGEFCLSSICFG